MTIRKLKLLYIINDFSYFVVRNFSFLCDELEKLCDFRKCHKNVHLPDFLKEIDFDPDFILFHDIKEFPEVSGINEIKKPLGMVIHDVHNIHHQLRIDFIEENNINLIFSVYKHAFTEWHPNLTERMSWLPHFVKSEIYKDYKLPKELDVLMMGILTHYYPLRIKIKNKLDGKEGFVYREHPGYVDVYEENALVGENYAKEMNRSKIFVTCDSIYHYPLMKYYEALACNTLLLAPANVELLELGFVPGIHFVSITENDFEDKIQYYLNHPKEREQIALAGYQMVHENHNSVVRAQQLVQSIEKFLKLK